jgi:cell fate (sporulation/competence/biofilm development) regulator YlbF (YheA/YmcA/DUF963 family)
MNDKTFLPPMMIEATHTLAQNLRSSKPLARYRQAKQILDSDALACGLFNDLAQAQARIRKAQAGSVVAREDLQNLRDLQTRVQENHVISEYNASQQEATYFLQEINTEISQLLGINFALIARRSSCC